MMLKIVECNSHGEPPKESVIEKRNKKLPFLGDAGCGERRRERHGALSNPPA